MDYEEDTSRFVVDISLHSLEQQTDLIRSVKPENLDLVYEDVVPPSHNAPFSGLDRADRAAAKKSLSHDVKKVFTEVKLDTRKLFMGVRTGGLNKGKRDNCSKNNVLVKAGADEGGRGGGDEQEEESSSTTAWASGAASKAAEEVAGGSSGGDISADPKAASVKASEDEDLRRSGSGSSPVDEEDEDAIRKPASKAGLPKTSLGHDLKKWSKATGQKIQQKTSRLFAQRKSTSAKDSDDLERSESTNPFSPVAKNSAKKSASSPEISELERASNCFSAVTPPFGKDSRRISHAASDIASDDIDLESSIAGSDAASEDAAGEHDAPPQPPPGVAGVAGVDHFVDHAGRSGVRDGRGEMTDEFETEEKEEASRADFKRWYANVREQLKQAGGKVAQKVEKVGGKVAKKVEDLKQRKSARRGGGSGAVAGTPPESLPRKTGAVLEEEEGDEIFVIEDHEVEDGTEGEGGVGAVGLVSTCCGERRPDASAAGEVDEEMLMKSALEGTAESSALKGRVFSF